MAKYRLLTEEELKGLEKEFVDYLVVNGITADDWVKIKADDPNKANTIIDLFSDVVFEKILRGVEYLERYDKNYVRVFHCKKDEIRMITLELEEDYADFRDPNFIAKAMANPPEDLLIYASEKPYSKTRELELFDMIQAGCLVAKDNLYNALDSAIEQI